MTNKNITSSRFRFLRFLLRILGWANVIGGIWTLHSGEANFLTGFLFTANKPLSSAAMGGVLLAIDLIMTLLSLPQQREERKNERDYRAACRRLPEGTGMAELNRQYRRQELNRRTLTDPGFCRRILDRYPCREVLKHIHSHNPQTAYMLSREILDRGVPATGSRFPVPGAASEPTPEKKPEDGLTASRIDGLNALLSKKKDAAPEGTPLKREDIQLGHLLDQYWHGCDYYDAANHRVMKYIAIPDGPQGFGPIQVPEEITTLEQLLPWLVENHDFHLKEE